MGFHFLRNSPHRACLGGFQAFALRASPCFKRLKSNVATPPFTPSVAAPDVVVPGLVGAAAAPPPPPSLAYPMMVPANGESHFAAVAGPAKPLGNLSHAAPVAGGQTYHSGMAPEGLPPGVSAPAALMIIGLIRPNHPAASLALIPNLITAGSTGFEAPRSAAPGLVTASIAAPVLTAPGIVPASARPPINRIAWINPVVLVPVITSSPGALVPAVTVPNVWLPTIAVPSVIVTASSINGVNASISVSVVLHGTH